MLDANKKELIMKTIFATIVATGLALTAVPAAADDHMGGNDIMLNASQKAMMDSWPSDRKQTYMNWPEEAQAYYWTLSEQQKTGWWMLDDPQRVRIIGMNATDQAAAWRSIASQIGTSTAVATTSNMTNSAVNFVSRAVVQSAPAPLAGEYPICENGRTDNCMNPWEAGKRGPGVPKPLGYFPQ